MAGLFLAACQARPATVRFAAWERGGRPSASLELEGVLPVPAEAQLAPGVVLLHGCSGRHGSNQQSWASVFRAEGYITLAVDSFGPRGVSEICSSLDSGLRAVSLDERVLDAFAAAAYLTEQGGVDPARLAVMGFSDGGTTAIRAVNPLALRDLLVPASARFRAAVALYPYCGIYGGAFVGGMLSAPSLIVIGGADDWTPAELCEPLRGLPAGGGRLEVEVLEGVTHSFDLFAWQGRAVGSRVYLGHRLSPDARATAEAERAARKHLREAFAER
jgi:dienelactone hydrolase